MKRIRKNMFRYGEKNFDLDYMKWGFHDKETQINEAKSILNILKPKKKLKILDLGCGLVTALYKKRTFWSKLIYKWQKPNSCIFLYVNFLYITINYCQTR